MVQTEDPAGDGGGTLLPSAVPVPGSGVEVRIGAAVIGGQRVPVLAGPCAVEPDYVEHALEVAAAGAAVLRGCVRKPRTSPHSFQGMGIAGLPLLDEARRRTGLPVLAEPLEPADVEVFAPRVDAFLIGARSMQCSPLLREVGRTSVPVILKRGLAATYDEWLAAAEYILAEGNDRVVLCERGIRTFEPATRNTLDLSAIPVLRERTRLPVIVDPSHAAGRAAWVPALAIAAVAAGADGLLVECHPAPRHALCDAAQAISPAELRRLVDAVDLLAAMARPLAAGSESGMVNALGVAVERLRARAAAAEPEPAL
ncbi:MAG TPA: 3-deoxy-7-phosphoheptulonate synthase [Candidatus Dormibacteraeota bacterium]|nr:3-deoxy-7-phosphoheptulonate synthase [Candidatus Dormibacteraeota bacterium]